MRHGFELTLDPAAALEGSCCASCLTTNIKSEVQPGSEMPAILKACVHVTRSGLIYLVVVLVGVILIFWLRFATCSMCERCRVAFGLYRCTGRMHKKRNPGAKARSTLRSGVTCTGCSKELCAFQTGSNVSQILHKNWETEIHEQKILQNTVLAGQNAALRDLRSCSTLVVGMCATWILRWRRITTGQGVSREAWMSMKIKTSKK